MHVDSQNLSESAAGDLYEDCQYCSMVHFVIHHAVIVLLAPALSCRTDALTMSDIALQVPI